MVNHHSEVDLRWERRLKRKSLTNQSYKKEPRQQASKKRKCLSGGLKDPDYKTFLENLKEYENSHALVMYNDNGEAEELRYEALNSRDRKSSAVRDEKKRVLEDSGGSLANSRRLRSGLVRNCFVSEAEELRYETFNSRKKKRVPENSGGSLANSRRLRSGLVRNCFVGKAEELRYETLNSRDGKSSATRNEKKRVPKNPGGSVAKSRRPRSGSVRNCSVGCKADTVRSGFVECDYDRQIIEHYVDYEDEEYGKFLQGKRSGKSVPAGRSSSHDDSFSERGDGSGSESSETGEDYCEFLELYVMEDEDVMSEQEGSDSDSDLVVLNVSRSAEDFVEMDLEDNIREDLSPRYSKFKKELLAVLKKPYDSKQHQELRDLVRVRNPVSESEDPRGGTKKLPSVHKLADSYLAIYPDFAEVFGRAKEDKLKSLKLLRGFFFYITKIGNRDIFQPWKYPELFKVMRKK